MDVENSDNKGIESEFVLEVGIHEVRNHSDKSNCYSTFTCRESLAYLSGYLLGSIVWDLSFDKARDLVIEMAGDAHGYLSAPSWDARDYLNGSDPEPQSPRKRLIRGSKFGSPTHAFS